MCFDAAFLTKEMLICYLDCIIYMREWKLILTLFHQQKKTQIVHNYLTE
jgi:hypothetical protein